ncbi:MAG TPA: aminopeptidase [Euryarchaeota archaeon]|nr:aminopeptidase [Euryarchaeota archaeon]
MADEKVKRKKVRRKLKSPYAWTRKWVHEGELPIEEISRLSSTYMGHLGKVLTERDAVAYWKERLTSEGFWDLDGVSGLDPGDGFFIENRGKGLLVGIAGRKDILEGANIIVSHLDSPRLDLKPRPVSGDGDTGLGMLRTHYYGGIKKYHWVNIPLCLTGKVVRTDGEVIDVSIGRKRNDPVFVIPDLLPHLSKTQNRRKLSDGIRGEELRAVAFSGPVFSDEEKDPVSRKVMSYLRRRYGISEEDLISSELCLVPAWGPREVGLDRGLIGSYGHDNRASSFSANESLLSMRREGEVPDRWCLSICFDKEEIGSEGPTSARSAFVELSFHRIMELSGKRGTSRELSAAMSSSFALSADVKSATNPLFRSVQDPANSARLGAGLTITKYTGRGGKIGANDASAEMVSAIRRLYNEHGIVWQMQETGKVDQGGGGTVAKFLAARNMDVLDTGIPLLSMHSPFEVLSKSDLYMAYKGFSAFFLHHPVQKP